MYKRGSIWLANMNPGRGTEPGKTRPVLIVQAHALLDAGHPSTLILPLTTHLVDAAEPLRFRLKVQAGLDKDSDVLVDQLRAIDNRRFVQGPLVQCDIAFMKQLDAAMQEILGSAFVPVLP